MGYIYSIIGGLLLGATVIGLETIRDTYPNESIYFFGVLVALMLVPIVKWFIDNRD